MYFTVTNQDISDYYIYIETVYSFKNDYEGSSNEILEKPSYMLIPLLSMHGPDIGDDGVFSCLIATENDSQQFTVDRMGFSFNSSNGQLMLRFRTSGFDDKYIIRYELVKLIV